MKSNTALRLKTDPSEQRRFVPVEHVCNCGASACYGLGWPLSPVQRWYCPTCLPANLRGDRRERRSAGARSFDPPFLVGGGR